MVLHYLRAWTNVNKLSANYFAIACQDVPVSMPTQEGEQSFLIVLHQPKIKTLILGNLQENNDIFPSDILANNFSKEVCLFEENFLYKTHERTKQKIDLI